MYWTSYSKDPGIDKQGDGTTCTYAYSVIGDTF